MATILPTMFTKFLHKTSFVLVLIAVLASAHKSLAQSIRTVAGEWDSKLGQVTLQETVKGDTSDVTGWHDEGRDHRAEIRDGKFDPKTGALEFTYFQPWRNVTGKGKFTLSSDGSRLVGEYSQVGAKGAWNLELRERATAIGVSRTVEVSNTPTLPPDNGKAVTDSNTPIKSGSDAYMIPKAGFPAWHIKPQDGWNLKYEDSNSIKATNSEGSSSVTFAQSDLTSLDAANNAIETYVKQNSFKAIEKRGAKLSQFDARIYKKTIPAENGATFEAEVCFAVLSNRYVFQRTVIKLAGRNLDESINALLMGAAIVTGSEIPSESSGVTAVNQKAITVGNEGKEISSTLTPKSEFTKKATGIYSEQEGDVTLTVMGQGKTVEEAQQQAFRDAIMQTYGVFVSSQTQVNNGKLNVDEIATITSGCIKHCDVVSKTSLPDGTILLTIKVVISPKIIADFCISKGIGVEYNGSLLAFTVKQQLLNENNETKAVDALLSAARNLIHSSMDFTLDAKKTPKRSSIDGFEFLTIPITVTIVANENYGRTCEYVYQTLAAISLSKAEADNYISMGKTVYPIYVGDALAESAHEAVSKTKAIFFLRNRSSYLAITLDLIMYIGKCMRNIEIADPNNNANLPVMFKTWDGRKKADVAKILRAFRPSFIESSGQGMHKSSIFDVEASFDNSREWIKGDWNWRLNELSSGPEVNVRGNRIKFMEVEFLSVLYLHLYAAPGTVLGEIEVPYRISLENVARLKALDIKRLPLTEDPKDPIAILRKRTGSKKK